MQVSAALRVEASKLFWAHPEAYFLVSAGWLIDGAHPAYTHWDLSFLPNVQNVLVDYHVGTDRAICPLYDGVMAVRQGRITAFWNSLTKWFPNVKRIVIDQNWLSPPWNGESQPVPRALRILSQSSSLDIQVFAFIAEEIEGDPIACSASIPSDPPCQRSLYRSSADGVWARAKSPQPWKTILPPARKFSGPVGKVRGLDHEDTLTHLQHNGLWPLMVEALDRHHFGMGNNNPFSCPSSTCDAYFQKAGEWTVHAAESHYCDWFTKDRFSMLPQQLRVEFEKREKALVTKEDEIRRVYTELRDDWREGGGRKQREMKHGWMEQLEQDGAWNTGTAPEESRLWREFLRDMENTGSWQ
ncbi:hypothetical protein CC86DRAFT_368526 [Ophiobolus disseminans]|uniref:C2H2-type domain-containing protein n=1 Tax=Ophiobolus disseminans TaxID=1469910 RepID=A0A6A7A8A3_9PLEO|nr:hypothetical protein CC86DRAFT_368526 [Ophiobolus disseminans]